MIPLAVEVSPFRDFAEFVSLPFCFLQNGTNTRLAMAPQTGVDEDCLHYDCLLV